MQGDIGPPVEGSRSLALIEALAIGTFVVEYLGRDEAGRAGRGRERPGGIAASLARCTPRS
ncbi:MAG: hypothetical protein WKF78_01115 [Candidatus Limnocylindrales bacterium]